MHPRVGLHITYHLATFKDHANGLCQDGYRHSNGYFIKDTKVKPCRHCLLWVSMTYLYFSWQLHQNMCSINPEPWAIGWNDSSNFDACRAYFFIQCISRASYRGIVYGSSRTRSENYRLVDHNLQPKYNNQCTKKQLESSCLLRFQNLFVSFILVRYKNRDILDSRTVSLIFSSPSLYQQSAFLTPSLPTSRESSQWVIAWFHVPKGRDVWETRWHRDMKGGPWKEGTDSRSLTYPPWN